MTSTAARIEEAGREREAVMQISRSISKKHLLNFLTDEGLIPNYAFPEEGITLEVGAVAAPARAGGWARLRELGPGVRARGRLGADGVGPQQPFLRQRPARSGGPDRPDAVPSRDLAPVPGVQPCREP